MDIIKTNDIKAVAQMTQAVMDNNDACVGRISGSPGTGKSIAGRMLVSDFNAIRVCCSAGITRKSLLLRLGRGFGLDDSELRGSADSLLYILEPLVKGRLLIFDEANHLNWPHMELLRYLPDECGASIILIGTEILDRKFRDGRSSIYLAQLARRIGGKQVTMGKMTTIEQVGAWAIQPRFGKVSKATAKAFKDACHGYWGEACELADTCERVMQSSSIATLNENVVKAATAEMAQRGGNR